MNDAPLKQVIIIEFIGSFLFVYGYCCFSSVF